MPSSRFRNNSFILVMAGFPWFQTLTVPEVWSVLHATLTRRMSKIYSWSSRVSPRFQSNLIAAFFPIYVINASHTSTMIKTPPLWIVCMPRSFLQCLTNAYINTPTHVVSMYGFWIYYNNSHLICTATSRNMDASEQQQYVIWDLSWD